MKCKTFAVGVDIGGTNTVVGGVLNDGEVLNTIEFSTQKYSTSESFILKLIETIKKIICHCNGKTLLGIGIGAPNANTKDGSIHFAPNLLWARNEIVPIAYYIQKEFKIKTFVCNDADAAAIGEKTFGVAQSFKHFIEITLGTGLGSGIVVDDKLLIGCGGFAGELGHTIAPINGQRICNCGNKNCLEAYCSAQGVVNTAIEMLSQSRKTSILRYYSTSELTSHKICIAAEQGDKIALEVFKFTGEILGKACASFSAFSQPEAYVFTGGLAKAAKFIIPHAENAFNEYALKHYKHTTKFVISTLQHLNAGVLGASSLVFDNNKLLLSEK